MRVWSEAPIIFIYEQATCAAPGIPKYRNGDQDSFTATLSGHPWCHVLGPESINTDAPLSTIQQYIVCDLEGRSDDCDPAVQLYDAGRSDRVAGAVSGCTGVAIHVTQEAKAGPGHDCCREAAKGVFKYPRARSCGRSYYSISDMRYSHIVGPSGHLHV